MNIQKIIERIREQSYMSKRKGFSQRVIDLDIAEQILREEAEREVSAKEICHQLCEAICHLVHEEVFERDSSVIKEMEAAIYDYNGDKHE